MARSINKVILLGNLTRDPILRYTQNGTAVCDFGLATNRAFTTNTGEKREEAEFHNLVAWGKLAEIASEYLSKGRKVYVEGRLQTRSYEKDDQKQFRTEIILSDLVMLDSKETPAKHTQPASSPATTEAKTPPAMEPEEAAPEAIDVSPEEIPF
jgi:single-strand DNA-binding protein